MILGRWDRFSWRKFVVRPYVILNEVKNPGSGTHSLLSPKCQVKNGWAARQSDGGLLTRPHKVTSTRPATPTCKVTVGSLKPFKGFSLRRKLRFCAPQPFKIPNPHKL